MDWLDLLEVQGTLKSLLQHHSSKALIFQGSTFLTVQLSHPYMTIGRNIVLTRWTFVGKVMSLLFNILSRVGLWRKLSTEELMLLNCGLEKTLESPLDFKEIQPVHSEGDQPWVIFGRNDAEVETPVLWPLHAKG